VLSTASIGKVAKAQPTADCRVGGNQLDVNAVGILSLTSARRAIRCRVQINEAEIMAAPVSWQQQLQSHWCDDLASMREDSDVDVRALSPHRI